MAAPKLGPQLNVTLIKVGITAAAAGSSRAFLDRMAEAASNWLFQTGRGQAPVRPRYFRAYGEVVERLRGLARRYPHLVRITDIGDSSEKRRGLVDRDIVLVTLTSPRRSNKPKPVVTFIGGAHPNEIANPELLLRWMEQLLAGYGTDPEATALLDSREIDLLPMANPDGRDSVVRAYNGRADGDLMQRTNTSPPHGTNINRNYDFRWGGNSGSSKDPTHVDYAGVVAGSEPETQAIAAYLRARKPGMLIDWHSMGQMNIYPWGDTHDAAPHRDALRAIAQQFSRRNGYYTLQGVDMYPVNGSVVDWAYGSQGIPAFTIETGLWFHQSDVEVADNFRRNAGVMAYAANIADAPYERAQGPQVVELAPTLRQGHVGDVVTPTGAGRIVAAEVVLDPSTPPGSGVALQAEDGSFDDSRERVLVPRLDAQLLAELAGTAVIRDTGVGARRALYVRARDDSGRWGPFAATRA